MEFQSPLESSDYLLDETYPFFGAVIRKSKETNILSVISFNPSLIMSRLEDLKLNPSEVYKVLSEQNLNEKYVYIKCRRTNRPKIDYLKTRIFGIIVSIYFGKKIFDAGGTPNLIHKDFFSQAPITN